MKKYLKVYGINNLQKIFVKWFIYPEFLVEPNLEELQNYEKYILEIDFKVYKSNELLNILDIKAIYFETEENLKNFKTTSYWNLLILDELLRLKENQLVNFFEISDEDLYFYNDKNIKKFKDNYFSKIYIDKKLWLFSSLFYYFSLNKSRTVNINWFLYLLNIKDFKSKFKEINENNNIILNKQFNNLEKKNYKLKSKFYEIDSIFYILKIFLSWKRFEKRVLDSLDENYLSIFFKVLWKLNIKNQDKNESHEFYINSILWSLDLDYYEVKVLDYIRSLNFEKINDNIFWYLFLILIKWNFTLILENPEIFKINKDLEEWVKLICYILMWIFDWYENLDKEIKKYNYENKIFNFILNNKKIDLSIEWNEIFYWKLKLNFFKNEF